MQSFLCFLISDIGDVSRKSIVDVGAATFSCVYSVANGDTVDLEVWIEGDGADNFVLESGVLRLIQKQLL